MTATQKTKRKRDMEKILRNAATDTWANARACAASIDKMNSKKHVDRIYRAIMAYAELRAVELVHQREPFVQMRARIAKLEGRLKELREARGR